MFDIRVRIGSHVEACRNEFMDGIVEFFEVDVFLMKLDDGDGAGEVNADEVGYDFVCDGHGCTNDASFSRVTVRHDSDFAFGKGWLIHQVDELFVRGFVNTVGEHLTGVVFSGQFDHGYSSF